MQEKMEYMAFFTKWLNYQFDHFDQELHKYSILRQVENIVDDNNEAIYWSSRDCWSMYYMAKDIIDSKTTV